MWPIWLFLGPLHLLQWSSLTSRATFVTASSSLTSQSLDVSLLFSSQQGRLNHVPTILPFVLDNGSPDLRYGDGWFTAARHYGLLHVCLHVQLLLLRSCPNKRKKAESETQTILYWELLSPVSTEKNTVWEKQKLTYWLCGHLRSEANWKSKIEEKLELWKESFRQLCQYTSMLNLSSGRVEPRCRACKDRWLASTTLSHLFTSHFITLKVHNQPPPAP